MLNQETNLPVNLMIASPPGTTTCPNAYMEWVRQASEHAFEFVHKQMHTSTERKKTPYDRNRVTTKFQVRQTAIILLELSGNVAIGGLDQWVKKWSVL